MTRLVGGPKRGVCWGGGFGWLPHCFPPVDAMGANQQFPWTAPGTLGLIVRPPPLPGWLCPEEAEEAIHPWSFCTGLAEMCQPTEQSKAEHSVASSAPLVHCRPGANQSDKTIIFGIPWLCVNNKPWKVREGTFFGERQRTWERRPDKAGPLHGGCLINLRNFLVHGKGQPTALEAELPFNCEKW